MLDPQSFIKGKPFGLVNSVPTFTFKIEKLVELLLREAAQGSELATPALATEDNRSPPPLRLTVS